MSDPCNNLTPESGIPIQNAPQDVQIALQLTEVVDHNISPSQSNIKLQNDVDDSSLVLVHSIRSGPLVFIIRVADCI
jgi:hypothetical protein